MSAEGAESIRMVTWLAPGLPLALFEEVRGVLRRTRCSGIAGVAHQLSGPEVGSRDPLLWHRPSGLSLCTRRSAAFDPRAGRLRAARSALSSTTHATPTSLGVSATLCFAKTTPPRPDDLRALLWLQRHLFAQRVARSGSELGHRQETPESFFGRLVHLGGHQSSLAALRDGGIDVASIDSNVLRTHPGSLSGLKVVTSVGPWPSQPVVVRASLSPERKARVREALASVGPWPQWGFVGFRAQAGPELDAVPPAAG